MQFSVQRRWIISMLGIYSCALMFAQRAGMSVAMVEMNNPRSSSAAPHFDWSETLQGVVLGSSFYIYWIVPAIAGTYMERFGGKWMAWMGVFWPCILVALEPWACSLNVGLLIFVQILIGVAHGFTYPALFHLYVQWFPPEDRSKANSGIQVGVSLGSAFMYLIGGYLCRTRIGWPLIFYVCSALHVPWLVLWWWLASDKPEEKVKIDSEQPEPSHHPHHDHPDHHEDSQISPPPPPSKLSERKSTPWLQIIKSSAVWSSILCKFAGSYGFFMFVTKLPTFLHDMYGMDIVHNSLVNSATMIAYGVLCFLSPYMANYLIRKQYLSLIATRKLFQIFAFGTPAISLILITMFDDEETVVVCLLILSMFGYGCCTGGEWTIISEFAPNLVGTISGITLALGFFTGIIAPYVVGLILDSDIGDEHFKWNLAFYLTSALYAICLVVFLVFGTDKRQAWDKN